jgi:hypothetical protein
MSNIIITILVAIALLGCMQFPIARHCRRNPVIGHWRPLLVVISIIWAGYFAVKVPLTEDIYSIRTDAAQHDVNARQIADFLRAGDLQSAFSKFGASNEGFDFSIGVIYAVTRAPQVAVIGVITLMAFSGLLTLLDVLVRSTGATRLPVWVVLMMGFYPEALFWCTDLWKEGLVLWGLCTMLQFIAPDPTKRGFHRWIAPIIGALVFAFLRPHIAFAWLVAIAMTQVIKQRRWGLAVISGAGVVVSFLLILAVAPRLVQSVMNRGLVSTLEGSLDSQSRDTGAFTGSQIRDSTPIPVITGMTLLFLRPYPWEAPHWVALLAGLEVWLLSGIIAVSWLNLRNWRKYMFSPMMLTCILVTFFLAFYFTYLFNLGLMVRQRMQFYPALMCFAATPCLIRSSLAYRGISMDRFSRLPRTDPRRMYGPGGTLPTYQMTRSGWPGGNGVSRPQSSPRR